MAFAVPLQSAVLVTNFDVILFVKFVVLQVLEEGLVAAEALRQRHQLVVVPVHSEDRLQSDVMLPEERPMLSATFAADEYAIVDQHVSCFPGFAVDAELVISVCMLLLHVQLNLLGHGIV